jgi:hypothetical protein
MVSRQPRESKAVSKKSATKRDDPAQSERFIKAARDAGADESKAGADRAFQKVAKPSKAKARN